MRRISFGTKLTTLVASLIFFGTIALSVMALLKITDFLGQQIGLRAQSTAISASKIAEKDLQGVLTADYVSTLSTSFHGLATTTQVETLQILDTTAPNVVTLLFDSSPEVLRTHSGMTLGADSFPPFSAKEPGYGAASFDTKVDDRRHPLMAAWAPIATQDERQVGISIVILDMYDARTVVRRIAYFLYSLDALLTLLAGYSTYKFSSAFEKAAVTDGLMKIYNHKFFKQRLDQEVARAKRYRHPLTLVLMDLDFFKKVNDTYGHAIGDLVLREMAKVTTASTRKTDVVCRYGGEEIAVILPHTPLEGAREFAERLRERVEDMVIKDPEEDIELSITVSVGVALYESGLDMMDLIKRADAALYHSKRSGRNRVSLYDPEYEMQAPAKVAPPKPELPPHPLRRAEDKAEFPEVVGEQASALETSDSETPAEPSAAKDPREGNS